MSNSLVSDQARRFVGSDLGSNCLQRLSADDTSRQRVKNIQLKSWSSFSCKAIFVSCGKTDIQQSNDLILIFRKSEVCLQQN